MSAALVANRRRDDVDIERDRELVERAQAGDGDAFGDLYLRYFDRLCRFCVRRLGNMSEAEDAAQEAFARAWKALPRFDGERRLYPWLSVIAANVCTDIVRRRGRAKVVDEPDLERVAAPVDGGQEAIIDRSDSDLLNVALSRISPRHREVLRLRESFEWSYQKIAAYQGVEVSTIETLLFRARRSLRREFITLAEAQGALAGALLLVLRRAIWRVRHLGAPAGAAKTAVPAVAGAGAGAGGGTAIGAGAIAALLAVGVLSGSALIDHHTVSQPVRAASPAGRVHPGAAGGAGAAAGRATSGRVGNRSTRPAAGGGAKAGSPSTSSASSQGTPIAAPVSAAKQSVVGTGSQVGGKVQQAGQSLVQTVAGVVATAGGIVQSVVSASNQLAPPTTLAPTPTTLPPVTVPTTTLPPTTLPPVTLPGG